MSCAMQQTSNLTKFANNRWVTRAQREQKAKSKNKIYASSWSCYWWLSSLLIYNKVAVFN